MTHEDNKTKRSTLPVVGCVRAIASYLCFFGDIQLRTLEFVDRKKVLWLFKKSNNSKTMEKELLIEIACEAYCKCCDTKECEELCEFNDFNCDWVCKFRKEFTKELNKKSKTKQQWKKN